MKRQAYAVRLFTDKELEENGDLELLRAAARETLRLTLRNFAEREGVRLGQPKFIDLPSPRYPHDPAGVTATAFEVPE